MAMTNFRAEDMRPQKFATTKPVGLVGLTAPVEEPKNFKKGKKVAPIEVIEEPAVVAEVEAEALAEETPEAPVEVDEA